MKLLAPAWAGLVGAFCAAIANPAAGLERAAPPRGANPAVLALLEAAEQEFRAGRPEQASAVLERALRIEPRNPAVWHDLGRVRLELGHSAEAEAMAAKAHSLNTSDRALRVRSAELMAAALRSSGRSPTKNELQVMAAPSWFDAQVERARAYVGAGERYEQRDSVEPARRWPPADAAPQPRRSVQPPTWRELNEAYSERVRRERAARRTQMRSRSMIVVDGRQYRRYGSNEPVRRQR